MIRLPTDDFRRLALIKPRNMPKGVDALAHWLFGQWRRRAALLRRLSREAEAVDRLTGEFLELDDQALQGRLVEAAQRFRRGEADRNPDLRIPALAALRAAAHRTTGLRAFPVQLMGASALDQGNLAEMATGEGKSLTAALAGVMAGWRGRPCHIITVNDYLAARDAKRFGRFYEFCRVTVGHVISEMESAERRNGYAADITYTTSKEVVADFLHDRLRLGTVAQPERRLVRQMLDPGGTRLDDLVMRGLGTAIVGEADSVLIDEAVTPLIICQQRSNDTMREATAVAARLADRLDVGTHYRVDRQHREIEMFEAADRSLQEAATELPRFWSGLARRRELVTQALTARELYQRDRQYVIDGGKIVIVDEFTGRLMPQRTWREGLHQAIEAKEGLDLSAPTEILARLSFQRFFRSYSRLSGMTGTASESAAEFWRIYGLPVIAIPTNRPCVREQWPDLFFRDSESRWRAVVEEVSNVHAEGRPILVGTRSVEASETLSRLLGTAGLGSVVLNAVRHAEEATIIARAGETGRITIATNMAGRGTDILLGGGAVRAGGLHVIATEPNESRRIDRQLFGRAGRQGQPGSARRFASMEDDVVRRFLPEAARRHAMRSFGVRDDEGVAHGGGQWVARGAVAYAQSAAQRLASRQRGAVLRHDTWLDEALAFAGPDAGS